MHENHAKAKIKLYSATDGDQNKLMPKEDYTKINILKLISNGGNVVNLQKVFETVKI